MNDLCGLFTVQIFRQIGYLKRKVRFERGANIIDASDCEEKYPKNTPALHQSNAIDKNWQEIT